MFSKYLNPKNGIKKYITKKLKMTIINHDMRFIGKVWGVEKRAIIINIIGNQIIQTKID